jgi:excinuclease ABC subunit B
MTTDELQLNIRKTRKAMEKAAKELDFIEAARLRDFLKKLQVKKGN